MKRAIVTLFVGLALAACESQGTAPKEAPPPEPKPMEKKAEPAEAAEGPQVPVSADFEEQAEAQITADNYNAELDKLAAEIEGE